MSLAALVGLAASVALAAQPPPKPRTPARTPAATAPVIEGVVRGPDRKPIDMALVIALAGVPWGPSEVAPIATRTDTDGRFRIALKRREPQTVRVEANGLAARTLTNVAPGTPLAIDLARGGTIEGVVRDGDTGQPLGSVRVDARDASGIAVASEPDAGRVVSATDSEGRFRIDGLAPRAHTVTATGRSAGFASQGGVRPGTRVELLVFPAATLAGTVTGPDNRPFASASVQAIGVSGQRARLEAAPTDASGRFELSGLDGGEYDVIALAPGLAPAIATSVVLERRGDARVDLALRAGSRVTGRLVDARDRPVAGRVHLAEIDGRPTPHVLGDRFLAEAAADGRFALDGVPPGENALGVRARGQGFERVEFTARASGDAVDLGDVRLTTGIVIRGRVRTSSGDPIAAASVMAFVFATGGLRGQTAIPFAETEGDGTFVLAGLEQVTYRVIVRAPGFAGADKMTEPGDTPVDLVLEPAGVLAGRVVDERSRALDAFRVAAIPDERGRHHSEEVATDDGRFALSDVSAGVYTVTVSAPGHAPTTVSGVKVEAGIGADVGTVTLRAGGVVRGSVVDEDGTGVPGASVSAAPASRAWSQGDLPQGTTDLSGAFELRGVAPGLTVVTASHPEHAVGDPATVDVDPAKPTADVRLVLSQGGRVVGSVRKRDGTPVVGAMVRVDPTRRVDRSVVVWSGDMRTGADGTFAVENVPAGPARLMVMAATRPGRFEGAQTREIEVRSGETTTVDVVNREILLTGRVIRASAPGAGLRVEARGPHFESGPGDGMGPAPSGAPQRMFAVTRADGGFEMLIDEAGPVSLSVSTADGRLRLPTRVIELPDVETHAVELEFNGVPVTGIVVEKETDAPVPYAGISAVAVPPRAGGAASGATSGPDGRFQLETDPGDHLISARKNDGGYSMVEVKAKVGTSGLTDLRLALAKGLEITGRVTDAGGRAAGGVTVAAVASRPGGRSFGNRHSLADGSFRIEGLEEGAYHLVAETDAGTFAVQPDVAAGTKDVGLALRPGGRVEVTVVTPSGDPVPGQWLRLARYDGRDLRTTIGRADAPTNAQGTTVILVPAGDVVIGVWAAGAKGEVALHVAEGESVSVRMTLTAASMPAP